MKDVAEAAGVSQPTVSFAYNRPGRISESQRRHVLETAERIGYPGPNALGKSLRSGKVGAIGLMMMDRLSLAFDDPSMIALLKGIGHSGLFEETALTLFPLNHLLTASGLPGGTDSLAVRGLADGLIITTLPNGHPIITQVQEREIPFVIVDAPKIPNSSFVGIDDYEAARTQMRHLLDLGHRRIGVLVDRLNPDGQTGPVSRQRFEAATEALMSERLRGYVEAAADAGISYNDLKIYEAGGLGTTAGQAAAFSLLNSEKITGIVATSDVMALGCLRVARDFSLNIPQDLSVVGFDDIPEAVSAGLTTIQQPMVEKGVIAAQFLRQIMDGKHPSGVKLVKIFQTHLILRSSTRHI